MCRLLVVNKLYLGNRELGFELMDLKKLEVLEMTAGQIKSALKSGKEILGVKVTGENELDLDKEKYFMTNIMKKVHINKLEPLYEGESSLANIFFYVVGVTSKEGETLFNVINSRFGRTAMTEQVLKVYYQMGAIAGGVRIEDDKIVISDLIKNDNVVEKKVEPVAEPKEENKKVKVAEKKVEAPLIPKAVPTEVKIEKVVDDSKTTTKIKK